MTDHIHNYRGGVCVECGELDPIHPPERSEKRKHLPTFGEQGEIQDTMQRVFDVQPESDMEKFSRVFGEGFANQSEAMHAEHAPNPDPFSDPADDLGER